MRVRDIRKPNDQRDVATPTPPTLLRDIEAGIADAQAGRSLDAATAMREIREFSQRVKVLRDGKTGEQSQRTGP
jgi:hypothetical protein